MTTAAAPFAELHEDHSLWQVFSRYREIRSLMLADALAANAKGQDAKRLRMYSRHLVELAVMAIALVLSVVSAYTSAPTAEVLGKLARDWSASLFAFATSLLGFLLAGFTIFASIVSTDIVVEFVRIKYRPGWRYSTLQVYTYAFVDVVVRYTAAVALHFVGLLLWAGGPLYWVLNALSPAAPKVGAYACLVMLAGVTVHLLVVLQSFIFNIFRFVVTMARSRAILAQKPGHGSSSQ